MHLCDERTARGWLRRGVPIETVAAAIGCTIEAVEAIPKAGRSNYAPLPSEMTGKLEAIQADWTAAQRKQHISSHDYSWLV